MAQLDLFPDLKIRRQRASKEYGAFTDKFKTKLTTDDCYTPDPVYNAVRDWCVEHYGLQGREIVRPFWPGADFEMYDACYVICNEAVTYANDRYGAGRERKSDFKTIEQKYLTQGETTNGKNRTRMGWTLLLRTGMSMA